MAYLGWMDIVVLGIYVILIASIGLYVARGNTTTAQYFIAGRTIPSWAVAFTLMATIVGSGTFVGHPGTSYQRGMILLVPHLCIPIVLLLVAKYIVPFYRRVVGMSAYEYIGTRFGMAGRLYTAFGFVMDRTFDLGVTLVTTGIAVNVLTGWDLRAVILGIGIFTLLYTMIGGIKAVVWTDVAQGIILSGGGLIVFLRLIFAPEAQYPGEVLVEAWRGGRLTLGYWELSWASLFNLEMTTVWLFSLTAMIGWGRRYVSDQHMVQRYLIARTDKEASRGTVWSAIYSVPIFIIFILIGACLYGFYQITQYPEPEVGDNVMPLFLGQFMPQGILGLILAAIMAASMSTVSSDLNSVSTVLTTDFFGNLLPKTNDRVRLLFGRAMVIAGGLLASFVALLLIPEEGALPLMERTMIIAAIIAGGTFGLFCLGFFTRRATRRGCYIGIAACVLFTTWAILTEPRIRIVDMGFNFPFNPILIGLGGHLTLFVVGYLASRLFGGYRPENVENLTFRQATIGSD